MTNEEKAKEIANKCKTITKRAIEDGYNGERIWIKEDDYNDCYKSALKMAQWKDELFAEERKELLGLVNMLPIDETNQTIIEDLKGLLK